MKIRNSFVSNSSSCSFVVYGLPFDSKKCEEAKRLKDLAEKYNIELISGGGEWDDEVVIGVGRFETDLHPDEDEYDEYSEIDGPSDEEVEAFKKMLSENGYDINKCVWKSDTYYDG